jgi:hypothetical protein
MSADQLIKVFLKPLAGENGMSKMTNKEPGIIDRTSLLNEYHIDVAWGQRGA